jgi:hypothetical protein
MDTSWVHWKEVALYFPTVGNRNILDWTVWHGDVLVERTLATAMHIADGKAWIHFAWKEMNLDFQMYCGASRWECRVMCARSGKGMKWHYSHTLDVDRLIPVGVTLPWEHEASWMRIDKVLDAA